MKIIKKNARFYTNQEVREILLALPKHGGTGLETIKYVLGPMVAPPAHQRSMMLDVDAVKCKLAAAGLTPFESAQLIGMCPQTVLDLHVVVEEMEERLSEEQTGEILDLFK